MQMISLASAVHVLPPEAAQPVAVVALIGTIEPGDGGTVRVQVSAAVPVRGGILRLDRPIEVVLLVATVAATQDVELPAKQPEPPGQ
jgi:hypothetical protein